MKNNTTIHTTLNIRYTGKNWQLSSNQIDETLQLSRHPQPRLPPQPSNIRAEKQDGLDGVRRIHENTGLRIIWGWILKQLHETTPLFNLIMIQESRKFALENFMISSHQNFNFIIRNDNFLSFTPK